MDADILTMSSKGQISIPAKIRKEMSVSSHFLQKNERITNIFARIARSEAVAILYQWVSNTFDTHIIL